MCSPHNPAFECIGRTAGAVGVMYTIDRISAGVQGIGKRCYSWRHVEVSDEATKCIMQERLFSKTCLELRRHMYPHDNFARTGRPLAGE